MQLLDNYLREVNPYYHSYKKMMEVEAEQEKRTKQLGINIPKISMYFKRQTGITQ